MRLALALLALWTTAVSAQTPWIEAEDGTLFGYTTVQSSTPGFSGTGYVTGFTETNSAVRMDVDLPAGIYDLTIRFATPNGQKGFDVTVAGVSSSGMFPATQGAFAEHAAGSFRLPGGPTTVVVRKGWGYFHIDAVRLTPATFAPPVLPPDALSDANATRSTRAMWQYLRSEYGRHVLSGQQSMPDLQWIAQQTGRTPAVGAFDLMDYSPSRVQRGSQPETTPAQMAAWAGDRGLISLSWHWNAPADLLDTPGHEWWRGFYTHATTFDIEAVLADPTSPRYQLLLRDIDAIAVQLQALQAADVPVLWRPLHEASGGWFWWGAKGPEPFKQLWRIMHDRLTNVHGLHNLVWVFTTQGNDAAWYPGDDVVDIVGRDTYGEGDPAATQRGEWASTLADYGGRKMITQSEAGGLHDPANSRDFGVWWSWFSVWSGRVRNATPADLAATFASDLVLTRDELPNWRAAPVADEAPAGSAAAFDVSVFPSPARGATTARVTLATGADAAALAVYDVTGRQVLSRDLGPLAAGEHRLSLDVSALPAGAYVVRVRAGVAGASARLTVVR